MTSDTTTTPSLTAPRVRVGRLLGFVLPATTAMYCLFNGIQQILLPAQVEAMDPSHKVGNLAVLTFALFFSYFTVSGYLFYTVTDYIGVDNLPGHNAAVAVATLSSITVVVWIVMATFCGWLADRLDRRKLFVSISAIGLMLTMIIPILLPTWFGMVLYSGLVGLFIGTYFAVDLAVMSLVLPNADQEGRDFGILAVATGLPTILSSVVAGALISFLGGYTALYIFGAVCALIAGTVILGIKSIR